ncbi:MAG: AsmA family protein [Rhizobiaceae bacterium]|jgi:AsmA protein|nr:AsmA family protein [Rhizobiaceae bacterium]
MIFGREWQGAIPGTLVPRVAWVLGIAALAVAVAIVALPYIASNRIVRDRIALEMGAWSGYDVSIGAAPEIRIWPDFVAVLTDVSLSQKDDPQREPVIEAERVEAELSPLAALRGDVVFSNVRLVRPMIRVRETPSGTWLPALPGGGRIARSIDAARRIVARGEGAPGSGGLPADFFGSVEFVGGTIVAGDTPIVTGLAGKVEWPQLNRPGSVQAEGTWRGETVSLDVASSNPLRLFGGGPADLSVTLRSAPASFRFEGSATLSAEPSFRGQGKFLAPSLRRFLEWSDAEAAGGAPSGSLGLESSISGNAERVRFEEATVLVNDAPGKGVIDLVLTGARPAVSGTLAFGALDLRSFLAAFTPLESSSGQGPGVIDPRFAHRVSLDLRLSASNATFDGIALADVAATAQVGEQVAAFDISDASAFGGNIQAGIRFRRHANGSDVEMRLLASEIDGGAFGAAAGLSGLVPIGRGNVSVILDGPGNSWQSILGSADGSISASFGQSALSSFNLERFLELARQGGFFALDQVSEGTLPIEAAELKAVVVDGVARIENAEARWPGMRLRLDGIMSYDGHGVALSGSIGPAGQQAAPIQRFFVGGSWTSPYISPVPVGRTE